MFTAMVKPMHMGLVQSRLIALAVDMKMRPGTLRNEQSEAGEQQNGNSEFLHGQTILEPPRAVIQESGQACDSHGCGEGILVSLFFLQE